VELTALAAVTVARFVLPFDIGKVFAGENSIGRAALNLVTLEASHARKRFVCKDHPKLIVNDDYTLIKFFEDGLHLTKPIWSFCGGISHSFAH
jgi:hypothetical protein